jgi:hypothetical protein
MAFLLNLRAKKVQTRKGLRVGCQLCPVYLDLLAENTLRCAEVAAFGRGVHLVF